MKLPYKYTICPPGPEPKQVTASSPAIGKMLRHGGDLTIDQRRYGMWQSWSNKPLDPLTFEDRLVNILAIAKAMGENT